MRRVQIFLVVLTVAIASLLTLVAISFYLATASPSYYQSSWIQQMWQGMGIGGGVGGTGGMGGMMGGSSGTPVGSGYWIFPVALIAAVVVGIVGFAFYIALPEIRSIPRTCEPTENKPVSPTTATASVAAIPNTNVASNSCEVILKTMTPEERKVLNVLIAHQGKYLQKYVGKEAGLSRLKTHRIVARFAERGIVTVKHFGNTNEVAVSDWVQDPKPQNPA
jgi:hypothetical protein